MVLVRLDILLFYSRYFRDVPKIFVGELLMVD